MTRFFITRPIFASVVSIIIFLAGLAAAMQLPIEQYPQIAPPTVLMFGLFRFQSGERGPPATRGDARPARLLHQMRGLCTNCVSETDPIRRRFDEGQPETAAGRPASFPSAN